MNTLAPSLFSAVVGIANPSWRPKEPPGPVSPGTSPASASPAMLDAFGSLASGRLPGEPAMLIAAAPLVNRSNDGPSSRVTDPGETQPLLSASTCHCRALTPAEFGSLKTG